jgi:hypothetical protein
MHAAMLASTHLKESKLGWEADAAVTVHGVSDLLSEVGE